MIRAPGSRSDFEIGSSLTGGKAANRPAVGHPAVDPSCAVMNLMAWMPVLQRNGWGRVLFLCTEASNRNRASLRGRCMTTFAAQTDNQEILVSVANDAVVTQHMACGHGKFKHVPSPDPRKYFWGRSTGRGLTGRHVGLTRPGSSWPKKRRPHPDPPLICEASISLTLRVNSLGAMFGNLEVRFRAQEIQSPGRP